MSEQIKPCLRNLVEAVDAGQQTLPSEQDLAETGVQYGELFQLEHGNFQQVKCLGCTALAEVDVATPQKVEYTTYEDMYAGAACETLNTYAAELPRMVDEFACLPTATAYALNRLGSKRTPADIDVWLGRQPGEFPPTDGFTRLSLELLQSGYALENVFTSDEVRMSDYYKEGSSLTYADYAREMIARDPKQKEWLEKTYTEEVFATSLESLRTVAKKFEPFESSGQFMNTWENITVDSIAERLREAELLAGIRIYDLARHTDIYHAVIVKDIKETLHGEVVMTYFNPNFMQPSEISVRRRDTVEQALYLTYGLTFIKPWDDEK
ncbi:MAG: hypothetical protein ABIR37_03585 [Candidatus Saccharimonadales bacterium]